MKYSEDGKYMYFLADSDGDGFALYAVKTGKGMGDAIKIDSNIYRYWVMKSGKDVVYIKDEVLYKNNLDGEKEKIASDVNTLLWDVNEKSLVWCEYRDDTYYWYYRPMDLSADEIKLFEDGHVFYFTDDLQKLYALIEDGILSTTWVKKRRLPQMPCQLMCLMMVRFIIQKRGSGNFGLGFSQRRYGSSRCGDERAC